MTEIRVPTLGESVTEATIGKWFKQRGDAVAADEPLDVIGGSEQLCHSLVGLREIPVIVVVVERQQQTQTADFDGLCSLVNDAHFPEQCVVAFDAEHGTEFHRLIFGLV